jgi:CRISPR type III-B/RAMP module RAMP protein Cmr1
MEADMLDKYEFVLKGITTLKMRGAKPGVVEWRAPSVKGLMRWWFRVVRPADMKSKVRKEEAEIFGGSGDEATASPFILRCESDAHLVLSNELYNSYLLRLKIAFYPNVLQEKKKKALASLWLAVNLGNFGSRSRRLYGSLQFDSAPAEKIRNLFSNRLDFSPLNNPEKTIPDSLDTIAEIFGIPRPLALEVYHASIDGRSLEEKYREFRRRANREKKICFGLPIINLGLGDRFASQIIFKTLGNSCLLTIIKSFELNDELRRIGLKKEDIILTLRKFCEYINAEKIYPKEGDKNV